jgi:tripartite-type tricarboxylate transporter receptor subunit TctC
MQEAGVPGYVNASWGAIIAPAKTPKAIVDKLNKDIVEVLNEPDTRERLAGLSAEVVANSQPDAAAFMNKETARLTKLIQDVGIQPE